MSTQPGTVERTRTEISVEEVTDTLYECKNCEIAYGDDEVMTVGLDLYEEDWTPNAERILCQYCAESIFDYKQIESTYISTSELPDRSDRPKGLDAGIGIVLALFIGCSVLAGAWIHALLSSSLSVLAPVVITTVVISILLYLSGGNRT